MTGRIPSYGAKAECSPQRDQLVQRSPGLLRLGLSEDQEKINQKVERTQGWRSSQNRLRGTLWPQ